MSIGLFILFGLIILAVGSFCVLMMRKGNVRLIHVLYFIIAGITGLWLLALMMMLFFQGNQTAEYIIDSTTNLVIFIPVLMLLVGMSFARDWQRLPYWCGYLFILPLFFFIMVWTNPLHHLHYVVFSIDSNEVEFGPLLYVNGVYSYLCIMLSMVVVIYSALKSKRSIHTRQAALFVIGCLIPLLVNILATSGLFGLSIYSTPLSYILGIICIHGLAIFKFHMLDIRPIAVDTILDRISDGYLVLSNEMIIVSHNRAFANSFGSAYNLGINSNLRECVFDGDMNDNVGMHTLLSSLDICTTAESTLSYEQSLTAPVEGSAVTRHYMVDITGLKINGINQGFVVFFKDITKLKESMRNLHNSQQRLMQRERLAFLGQMLGGISHNLKTPIMSISGSVDSVDKLTQECISSLGDPDVSTEDFMEIYGEIRVWLSRIQEACSYMSDIITAVKGQATNFNANRDMEFIMDDVIKRVSLLLRHEFLANNCTLKVANLVQEVVYIRGDINSMVQVLNNLVGNAVDAMKGNGGEIEIELNKDEKNYFIKVKDRGRGMPENVKRNLFSQMVTTKGAMGSGLGIFMSNSFIKARFDGTMWFEDNPGGGTIFGISLPLNNTENISGNYDDVDAGPMGEEEDKP